MSLEELKFEVGEKLSCVESTLAKVEEVHRDLQENARKVEVKIQEAAERQVEVLRVRERQLVRQVQVVTYLDGVCLRSRQAGLMHKLGSLTATQDLLNRCSHDETHTLSKIKVDDLDPMGDVQCMSEVSVEFDEAPLNSAIGKFGSVQLPERITHHTSPVIPTSVEEYDDGEHEVLHKSVAGVMGGSVPGAPVHVTVQFPRLAHHTWLANNTSTTHRSPHAKGAVLPGTLSKSADVASWVTGLQLGNEEGGDFSAPASAAGFDMLTDTDNTNTISDCSSIEIVPSHYGSEKVDCSTPASGMCEIENLHTFVGEKSCWLSPESKPAKNSPEILKVSSVCKANEICQSFNDCLCQNKCRDTAMEKLQQSADYRAKVGQKRTFSESQGCQPILAHMANILASENSKWLVQQHESHPGLPIPLKRVMYQAPGDKWLKLSGHSSHNSSPHIQFSTHSNIWLLKNMKLQTNNETKDKEENEKETGKDEKEEVITMEALTEALMQVSVSYTKETNTSLILDNSCNDTYDKKSTNSATRVSFLDSEQPWLLSRNPDNRFMRDNRIEEKEAANKKQWLINSSKNSQMKKTLEFNEGSPLKKRFEAMSLPESVLSVAQAGINNWLMKNCN